MLETSQQSGPSTSIPTDSPVSLCRLRSELDFLRPDAEELMCSSASARIIRPIPRPVRIRDRVRDTYRRTSPGSC